MAYNTIRQRSRQQMSKRTVRANRVDWMKMIIGSLLFTMAVLKIAQALGR